jgi:hypothetical protein
LGRSASGYWDNWAYCLGGFEGWQAVKTLMFAGLPGIHGEMVELGDVLHHHDDTAQGHHNRMPVI